MNQEIKDCFDLFELDEGCDFEHVRNQYKFLLQSFHPDKHPDESSKEKANEKTKKVINAYKILEEYFKSINKDEYKNKEHQEPNKQKENKAEKSSEDVEPPVFYSDEFYNEKTISDEEIIRHLKKYISIWSDNVKHHPHQQLGDKIKILSIYEKPVYNVLVKTQMITRSVSEKIESTSGSECTARVSKVSDLWEMVEIPFITEFTDQEPVVFPVWGSFRTFNCSECNGTGKVRCTSCKNGIVKCNSCNGTGRSVASSKKYISCSNCDGTGRTTCRSCDGTSQAKCNNCDGKGMFLYWLEMTEQIFIAKDDTIITHPSIPKTINDTNQDKMYYLGRKEDLKKSNNASGVSDSSQILIFKIVKKNVSNNELLKIPLPAVQQQAIDRKNISRIEAEKAGKVYFHGLIVNSILLYEVKYQYNEQEYILWYYADEYIYAPRSPISEVEDQTLKDAEQLFKKKKYSNSHFILDKVLEMSPKRKEALELKKQILRKVLWQYLISTLIGSIATSYGIYVGQPKHYIIIFSLGIILGVGCAFLLKHFLKAKIGELFIRAILGLVVSSLVTFTLTGFALKGVEALEKRTENKKKTASIYYPTAEEKKIPDNQEKTAPLYYPPVEEKKTPEIIKQENDDKRSRLLEDTIIQNIKEPSSILRNNLKRAGINNIVGGECYKIDCLPETGKTNYYECFHCTFRCTCKNKDNPYLYDYELYFDKSGILGKVMATAMFKFGDDCGVSTGSESEHVSFWGDIKIK
jgi:DnaJ-class molecular chaperone